MMCYYLNVHFQGQRVKQVLKNSPRLLQFKVRTNTQDFSKNSKASSVGIVAGCCAIDRNLIPSRASTDFNLDFVTGPI